MATPLRCATCRDSGASVYETLVDAKGIGIKELPHTLKTGDIVLFSSKHAGSKITRFFTNSVWDHVGIVVSPTMSSRSFLVEWGGGLFATELVERLTDYATEDARLIMVRRLKLGADKREHLEDEMEDFLDMLFRNQLGSNSIIPFDQVARTARRQLFPKSEGAEPFIDDLTSLFCSKLAAVAYKSIGILSAQRDASTFLPKHFSSAYPHFLNLQQGAELGPEMRVTFELEAFTNSVVDTVLFLTGINLITGVHRQRIATFKLQRVARGYLGRLRARRQRQMLQAARAAAASAASAEMATRAASAAKQKPPPKSEETTSLLRQRLKDRSVRLGEMSAKRPPRADGLLLDGLPRADGLLMDASSLENSPRKKGGYQKVDTLLL